MREIQDFTNKAMFALGSSFNISDTQKLKIINRYIKAVADEINSKETKFYRDSLNHLVSLMNISNKSKATINKERQYMHQWFMDHCPLFKIVELGSNIDKKFTEISMYYQINTIVDLMYQSVTLDDPVKLEDAINTLYGDELAEIIYRGEEELYDIVPIDVKSIKAFIDTTNTYIDTNKKMFRNTEKLERRVREAKRIYTLASVCNGHLIQIINKSEFGRRFYKGPNLQSVHKDVRHAALGNCIEYDINNSVYAWRLTEAKRIAKEHDIKTLFPATMDYMDRKDAIRSDLANKVFKTSNLTVPFKVKLIKRVFTAIGFGAQGSSGPAFWDVDGDRKTYAINNIIRNPDDRNIFFKDGFVKEFMEEQQLISKVIFAKYKDDYVNVNAIRNESGRMSEAKLLAYLYQHVETSIIDDALSHIPKNNILLRCHDAFYVSHISAKDIAEVRYKLKSHIKEITVDKTVISEWVRVDPRFTKDINQEKRLKNDIEKAKTYVPEFVNVVQLKPAKTPEVLMQERRDEYDKKVQMLEAEITKHEIGKEKLEQLLIERVISNDSG